MRGPPPKHPETKNSRNTISSIIISNVLICSPLIRLSFLPPYAVCNDKTYIDVRVGDDKTRSIAPRQNVSIIFLQSLFLNIRPTIKPKKPNFGSSISDVLSVFREQCETNHRLTALFSVAPSSLNASVLAVDDVPELYWKSPPVTNENKEVLYWLTQWRVNWQLISVMIISSFTHNKRQNIVDIFLFYFLFFA